MQQYYKGKGKWEYMPVVGFAKAFDQTEMAKTTRGALAQPYQAPNPKCEEALIQYKYALNGEWVLLVTSALRSHCAIVHKPIGLTHALPVMLGGRQWASRASGISSY